jgi:hypothetical protein
VIFVIYLITVIQDSSVLRTLTQFEDSDASGLRLGFGLGEAQAFRVIHLVALRWRRFPF